MGVPYVLCVMNFCIDCAQCVGCGYEMEIAVMHIQIEDLSDVDEGLFIPPHSLRLQ